jgi:hypothetical protein
MITRANDNGIMVFRFSHFAINSKDHAGARPNGLPIDGAKGPLIESLLGILVGNAKRFHSRHKPIEGELRHQQKNEPRAIDQHKRIKDSRPVYYRLCRFRSIICRSGNIIALELERDSRSSEAGGASS